MEEKIQEDIATRVARQLNLPVKGVEAAIELLDEGATVAFISRYRKEATGSLDEVQIRNVEIAAKRIRDLDARRDFVMQSITETGSMTPEIASRLHKAESLTDIEDIYLPFKPKKRTRASMARERGLEPLAKRIMSGYLPAEASDSDIDGACDIIAEWASESPRLRNMVRRTMHRSARIVTKPAKDKEAELKQSPLAQYADFQREVRRMASHQYLALRRAEREGLVKVKYDIDSESDRLDESLITAFMPRSATAATREVVEQAVKDANKRLIRPSVENEISSALKADADKTAIEIFSGNLRELLLGRPLKGHRILAIDPGYRTGCKVVALDEQGTLLADDVIYPTAPRNDTEGARRKLERMIRQYRLDTAAIGNGTASHETERFVKESGLLDKANVYIVSEDGASVYSASEIGRKEFPDKDVTVRGAVSIGRRLIDPLAELVKIDPKSIGVGQYQHDVDQGDLKDALDYTVAACVNAVGVDVNTASEKLLSYVSGIGPALAANIVKYRVENGPFTSRAQIRKVPRLGDKAFELCAGFLRIPEGKEPLDNTGIHPESYGIVNEMARSLGVKVSDLPANNALLDQIDIEALARKRVGGLETMKDIVAELRKPGRDPRTEDASADFVPSVDSFEQLAVGQKVNGQVSNITAFGAFVDLGIKENGLIHISRLARRRVSSVSEVLKLGQQVEATVIEIDPVRRRIALSMI